MSRVQSDDEKPRITAIILTYNEEVHLERALKSIASLATEMFVIDSFSSDQTINIARSLGAIVLQHKFINQADQFNWALDNIPVTGDWIMRLDADEIIEPDLAVEITQILPDLASDVVGVNLKRKHIFMNKWIKHGGRYPLIMLRVWRTGYGRAEERWMDEHIIVQGGRTVTLEGGFLDHNLKDLTFFTDKHNYYATREAIEILNQRYHLFSRNKNLTRKGTSLQASIKRFFKEAIYNRIPFTIGASLYFVYRYIFQLGFLDGRSGLIYHFLQGHWYRFLVGAKVMEFEQAINGVHDKQKIIEVLSTLSSLDLNSLRASRD